MANDVIMRRVGWSFVVYDEDTLWPVLGCWGGLDTTHGTAGIEHQTVPLAELAAAVWLATRTEGYMTVECDCSYVVDLFAKDPTRWDLGGVHGHWLQALRTRLAERKGTLLFQKIDSHKAQVALDRFNGISETS